MFTTTVATQCAPRPQILVHDCFQFGEPKPERCGCAERIGAIDAAVLVRNSNADYLTRVRNGKTEQLRNAIVLRRDYVEKRLLRTVIDPRKLLPAILQSDVVSPMRSFCKAHEVILALKNGTRIGVDSESTDARYWNTVLAQIGVGTNAGRFLKDAAASKGQPIGFSLSNWVIALESELSGVDQEIEAERVRGINIHKRAVEARRKHRVHPRGPRPDEFELSDSGVSVDPRSYKHHAAACNNSISVPDPPFRPPSK